MSNTAPRAPTADCKGGNAAEAFSIILTTLRTPFKTEFDEFVSDLVTEMTEFGVGGRVLLMLLLGGVDGPDVLPGCAERDSEREDLRKPRNGDRNFLRDSELPEAIAAAHQTTAETVAPTERSIATSWRLDQRAIFCKRPHSSVPLAFISRI